MEQNSSRDTPFPDLSDKAELEVSGGCVVAMYLRVTFEPTQTGVVACFGHQHLLDGEPTWAAEATLDHAQFQAFLRGLDDVARTNAPNAGVGEQSGAHEESPPSSGALSMRIVLPLGEGGAADPLETKARPFDLPALQSYLAEFGIQLKSRPDAMVVPEYLPREQRSFFKALFKGIFVVASLFTLLGGAAYLVFQSLR